jgi:DNA-3-methyladenine glycosylase II
MTQASLWTHSGFLPATPPFNFDHALEFLADFGPMRDDQVITPVSLMRAMLLDGRIVVYRVAASEAPGLGYTLWSDSPMAPDLVAAAEDRISFSLSLADDLAPLYALAEGDAVFEAVVEQQHGYHQVKFPTPFENAVWAILSQRNTATSARTMRSALVRRYGAQLEVEGMTFRAFPEATAIVASPPGEVAKVIGHSQKGPGVSVVAEAFSRIDERWLRLAPYDEVQRWMLDIHGIGPWGASFVMLRGVGRMERLPRGERKLLATIGQAYGRGGPVTERDAERLGERYGSHRGYWAHYLRVAV